VPQFAQNFPPGGKGFPQLKQNFLTCSVDSVFFISFCVTGIPIGFFGLIIKSGISLVFDSESDSELVSGDSKFLYSLI